MNIVREIQKLLFPKTLKCVYKKDILEYALKHHTHNSINYGGLCITIDRALRHYGLNLCFTPTIIIFPLFNHNNARKFNSNTDENSILAYWWPKGIWDTGRLDFLKWLLEQYKDDKTNLKKY